MKAFLRALILALGDLRRPAVSQLLLKSILITIVFLIISGAALFYLARLLAAQSGYLDGLGLDMASLVFALLLLAAGWLLFRVVAIFVIGLFADSIVESLEAIHYPAAAHMSAPMGFWRSWRQSSWSFLRFAGANVAALPLYIILIPTAVGVPILALILNGWLLGYDMESMVKARHLALPPLSRQTRWALGLLSVAIISIPIVNFLAPIFSAAMAVHLFHSRSTGPS